MSDGTHRQIRRSGPVHGALFELVRPLVIDGPFPPADGQPSPEQWELSNISKGTEESDMKIRSLVEGLGVIGALAILGTGIYVALTSFYMPPLFGIWGTAW